MFKDLSVKGVRLKSRTVIFIDHTLLPGWYGTASLCQMNINHVFKKLETHSVKENVKHSI